jgi:hypothetical protein
MWTSRQRHPRAGGQINRKEEVEAREVQTMSEPTQAEYALAIAERDEAIAERDYILDFLIDLGEALSKSQRIHFQPTATGVEVLSFYSSLAEALQANLLLRDLRAMLSLAPRKGDAALARVTESRLHA